MSLWMMMPLRLFLDKQFAKRLAGDPIFHQMVRPGLPASQLFSAFYAC